MMPGMSRRTVPGYSQRPNPSTKEGGRAEGEALRATSAAPVPRRRTRRFFPLVDLLAVGLVLALTTLPAVAADLPPAPRLVYQGDPDTQDSIRRLEAIDPVRLAGAMRLTGLDTPGRPIRVVVASERSDLARRAPPWVAGYASGTDGPIVVFPARAGAYPYDSLEELLQHEVAHVLVNRAAGGRPVPRWLHEGIAMTAGDRWGLEDRGRFALDVARGGAVPLARVDRLFRGSSSEVRRAYAVSGGFVNHLLRRHGPRVTGDLLAGLAAGRPLEDAFAAATGEPLAAAEERFWRRQTFWHRWVPLLGSSTVLWIGVTLLALLAFRRRRRRDAELMARWEDEDAAAARAAAAREAGEPRSWIH